MSEKDVSKTGSFGDGENIAENSTELSKIEMTDAADNEALQKESFNHVESETNGVNVPESQSLEGEEVDEQVRTACTVLDLRYDNLLTCNILPYTASLQIKYSTIFKYNMLFVFCTCVQS